MQLISSKTYSLADKTGKKYDNQLYNYAINRFNKSVNEFSFFDKRKVFIDPPNKIVQKFFK